MKYKKETIKYILINLNLNMKINRNKMIMNVNDWIRTTKPVELWKLQPIIQKGNIILDEMEI